MADRTGIAWTDATFNPVWGCTRVSSACDHCYAEEWARRFGVTWGPHGEFRTFGEAHWNGPRRWNRQAERDSRRMRVFCASMADVFDNRWPEGVRERLWALIRETPHLDWQLLTKRPQNIAKMLPPDWGHGFHNVWLGTTVENQEEADRRISHLLAVPAAVRFLSCEPLLGPVRLQAINPGQDCEVDSLRGESWRWGAEGVRYDLKRGGPRIHWIIIGGESGHRARPMRREWAEALLEQCRSAGVPAFFKQVGSARGDDWPAGITGKGDDPTQWPAGLRVQEFPRP